MSLKKIIQSEDASWPEDTEKEYTICRLNLYSCSANMSEHLYALGGLYF